jgi:hypothetical protein
MFRVGGSPRRLSDDGFEFLVGPDHPISDFRHNDNLVLGKAVNTVGVPRSPRGYTLDVKASAENGGEKKRSM